MRVTQVLSKRLKRTQLYGILRNAFRTALHILGSHDSVYDDCYYAEDVKETSEASAVAMASSLAHAFRPHSVIDVGCGTGALLIAFRDLGCEVVGFECSRAALKYCHHAGLNVRKFNIEKDDLVDMVSFDLAVSFEVAEHLPIWTANRYVQLLCRLAPHVAISAATQGQLGTDHINEQPHSYWIKKFAQNDYAFDEEMSVQIQDQWRSRGVAWWYSNNVMIFSRR